MRTSRPGLGILGGPSAIGTPVLGLTGLGTDQADSIDAITKYVTTDTPVKTDAARGKQDEYKGWVDTVSWYDKNYDRPTYDHARNLRNDFNTANAVTAAEKAAVKNVITTGLTTEEMQGAGRRISSEGKFSEQDSPTPSWVKWAIGGAVGIGALYALGKFTTLAQIFAGKRYGQSAPAHAKNPGRRRRARR